MFGLKYILQMYGMTNAELANILKINRANITMWIKQMEIPEAKLEQLSSIFPHVPIGLFQKELTRVEQITIQISYLQHTDTKEIVEVPVTDDDGNIVGWREESYSVNASIIDVLDNDQEVDSVIERVKVLISDNNLDRRLLEDFLEVMERGKETQLDFLLELLLHLNGKKERLFMAKYDDLEQYLGKYGICENE